MREFALYGVEWCLLTSFTSIYNFSSGALRWLWAGAWILHLDIDAGGGPAQCEHVHALPVEMHLAVEVVMADVAVMSQVDVWQRGAYSGHSCVDAVDDSLGSREMETVTLFAGCSCVALAVTCLRALDTSTLHVLRSLVPGITQSLL